MKEVHNVIVSFPKNKFVDHVVLKSNRATDVVNEIMLVLKETESIDILQAIANKQELTRRLTFSNTYVFFTFLDLCNNNSFI